MQPKYYYVYILTNKNNTVLYTGMTSDLAKRVWQHKTKLVDGFTNRYCVDKLVYYEQGEDILAIIEREKNIKNLLRKKKIALINKANPDWIDLFEEINK